MSAAPSKVGILGGMGPAAGADFVRLFVQACERHLRRQGQAVTDQAYPEHWLVQVPVPDRTDALLSGGEDPFDGMARAVKGLQERDVASIAIACNTAHAWHAQLRAACPTVELLHIVEETVRVLAARQVRSVGLMATLGTHRLDLYQSALERAGIACHLPTGAERIEVMRGIRDGVKAGDLTLATSIFTSVASALVQRHWCEAVVMACTEIPLALHRLPEFPDVGLVDPAQLLADALAGRAYGVNLS